MRKLLISGLIVLIFFSLSTIALAGSPFVDDHGTIDWAYAAIEELAQRRNIPGIAIPKEPNRNQGALMVARLLQHLSGEDHVQSRRFGVSQSVYLDNMIFGYNQRVSPEKAFTSIEVETLYRLVLEFREELEVLGYDIQDFNLLLAESNVSQGRLLTTRSLLYSEQALSAARKAEDERQIVVQEAPEPVAESLSQLLPNPLEPRNLWTGQFSSVTRVLPPSSSFIAQEDRVQPMPSIQIGGLEVSSSVRSHTDSYLGTESGQADVGPGYGLSVRMGDVALQTALDLDIDTQLVKAASASVDLSWDWADLFTFSAGYRLREKLQNGDEEDDDAPFSTSLGVTVPISGGQVHLGMTQEWNLPERGGLSISDGELSRSAKSTAELGLSYGFNNDSSLRFNYRLIDFSNVQEDYGAEAEAAFSIKF